MIEETQKTKLSISTSLFRGYSIIRRCTDYFEHFDNVYADYVEIINVSRNH